MHKPYRFRAQILHRLVLLPVFKPALSVKGVPHVPHSDTRGNDNHAQIGQLRAQQRLSAQTGERPR